MDYADVRDRIGVSDANTSVLQELTAYAVHASPQQCASGSHSRSPIPNMVKRRGGTQTDSQRNSAMSGQTIVEQTSNWDNIDLDDKKPKYFEEREHTHWQEEIDSRTTKPSKTFSWTSSGSGSTGYSQRSGSRHSGQRNDGFQLQPLHTPEFSRQQGQWGKSAFSP